VDQLNKTNHFCVFSYCSSDHDGVGQQVLHHHIKTPRTEELLLIDRKMVGTQSIIQHNYLC